AKSGFGRTAEGPYVGSSEAPLLVVTRAGTAMGTPVGATFAAGGGATTGLVGPAAGAPGVQALRSAAPLAGPLERRSSRRSMSCSLMPRIPVKLALFCIWRSIK